MSGKTHSCIWMSCQRPTLAVRAPLGTFALVWCTAIVMLVSIYGSRDHRLPSSHGCGFCWACVVTTSAEVAASPRRELFVVYTGVYRVESLQRACGSARAGYVCAYACTDCGLLIALCTLHHRPPAPVRLLLGDAPQTNVMDRSAHHAACHCALGILEVFVRLHCSRLWAGPPLIGDQCAALRY